MQQAPRQKPRGRHRVLAFAQTFRHKQTALAALAILLSILLRETLLWQQAHGTQVSTSPIPPAGATCQHRGAQCMQPSCPSQPVCCVVMLLKDASQPLRAEHRPIADTVASRAVHCRDLLLSHLQWHNIPAHPYIARSCPKSFWNSARKGREHAFLILQPASALRGLP